MGKRQRQPLVMVVAVLLAVAGTIVSAAATPERGATPSGVDLKPPQRKNYLLSGVAAVGPNDLWAVGHWIQPISNIAGIGKSPKSPPPLYRITDGRWEQQKLPRPAGGRSALEAVVQAAGGTAWAIGTQGGYGGTDRPWLLHYNGLRWSTTATTLFRRFRPYLAQADPTSSVIAVDRINRLWIAGSSRGRPAIAVLSGGRWRVLKARAPKNLKSAWFSSVAAVPGTSLVYAAGGGWQRKTDNFGPIAATWNGRGLRMNRVRSPLVSVGDIDAVGPQAAYLVGRRWGRNYNSFPVVLRRRGNAWVPTKLPSLRGADLRAVSIVGPSDVWVFGQHARHGNCGSKCGDHALALHFDGSKWTTAPGPDPLISSCDFCFMRNGWTSSTVDPSGHVWTVGQAASMIGVGQTLSYPAAASWTP